MCIKYIRRYKCPQGCNRPNRVHALESTIPCSNPIACVGEGFGTRVVSFSGSCEQHTDPKDWAAFAHSIPEQDTFDLSRETENLAGNISRYVDSLLDFWVLLMNDALPRENGVEYVTLQRAVETISRELRCPRCEDDVTVCSCEPGENRAMFNISRAFRTAEAQRLLPILTQRFGEAAVRQAVQQAASYTACQNRQGQEKRLLYDFEPPIHGTTVEMERRMRDCIHSLQNDRRHLYDQGNELGRIQWSAVNIIGSYFKFDSGVPKELAEYIGRAVLPMMYPEKAIRDRAYRFQYRITSGNGETKASVRATRLTDATFWASYQAMIQKFRQLVNRKDKCKTDLNAISVAIANQMEDLRITFHDLHTEERNTFYLVAKDLLPVMKHVTTEELERNQSNPPAKCIVCKLPFSTQVLEPQTPAVGTFPATETREQQVHTPVRYEQCAFVPNQHAFCLREWARQLMSKPQQQQGRKVLCPKPKKDWRCKTCYVDPWRAG